MVQQTTQPSHSFNLRGSAVIRRRVVGAVRRIGTVGATIGIVGIAVVAVQVGTAVLQHRAEAAPTPDAAPLLPVNVQPMVLADGFETDRTFVGRLEAAQESDVAFEFAGLVSEILVDEGDTVAQGDVVARLDTAMLETEAQRLQASRDALVADLAFAETSVERRRALQARGHTSAESLDEARFSRDALIARIAEIDALIARVQVERDKSVLYAPFDGRIAARGVDVGETVAIGQSIATVMQVEGVEVRVGVPLWVDAAVGAPWPVTVGRWSGMGIVRSVRPDIDPATRTRTAILTLDTVRMEAGGLQADGLAFGAAAMVTLPRWIEAEGAWVPLSSLREGASGVWTVLTVETADEGDVVRSRPIEILHVEADRVFVGGGLSPDLSVIAEGPNRVTPGQRVDAFTTTGG